MRKSTRANPLTGTAKHKMHLSSIAATIIQAPTVKDLEEYIPEFVSMTWLEENGQVEKIMELKGMNRHDVVMEMFEGRTLPTAMETIRITMALEGLDMTNVTHILRHRMFGFSAQSSGWGSLEGHDFLHNEAYVQNSELAERAITLCNDSLQLYKDALDSGMTFYDARHYMPFCQEQKYMMTGDLKSWMMFINTRLDRTNQPTSDNILAARCRQQLLKFYPMLEAKMPPKPLLGIYMTAIQSKFNVNTYPPDKEHAAELKKRGVDWTGITFDNPLPRDEYRCNVPFEHLFNQIINNEV